MPANVTLSNYAIKMNRPDGPVLRSWAIGQRKQGQVCLGSAYTERRLPYSRGGEEELRIGEAIRTRMDRAELSAPHEWALFVMAPQRLDDPGSKLGCAPRWLPDVGWLPEVNKLAVDQLYRALDFLAVWSEEIERDVFLGSADLLRLDVDLIFYDTTTAYFEIGEPDEHCELWGGKLFSPLRQRGHSINLPKIVAIRRWHSVWLARGRSRGRYRAASGVGAGARSLPAASGSTK